MLVVYGGVVILPYIARLGESIRDGRPDREDLLRRRLMLVGPVDAFIDVLVIGDMVLKPFGS